MLVHASVHASLVCYLRFETVNRELTNSVEKPKNKTNSFQEDSMDKRTLANIIQAGGHRAFPGHAALTTQQVSVGRRPFYRRQPPGITAKTTAGAGEGPR